MRICPVCTSSSSEPLSSEPLYTYPLSHGGEQAILHCRFCGMVYATVQKSVDYTTESIYALPNALGSGASPFDKKRLLGLASKLADEFGIPLSTSILDIGCAQGGLLQALKENGFTNLIGMDPSEFCVRTCEKRGFKATLGHLGARHTPLAGLTILSHVLEHIEHPREALRSIQSPLLYVEVPNAERYKDYPIPFLDFNSEHINHFDLQHLLDLLAMEGFFPVNAGEREITLTNGTLYPAIYVLAKKVPALKDSIVAYIAQSEKTLMQWNNKLEKELEGEKEVILWGAGEYMTMISNLPIFSLIKPVQLVDRNPVLHGKLTGGLVVEPTSSIKPDLPIVICAIVAIVAIRRDAEKMGINNRIVSVQ